MIPAPRKSKWKHLHLSFSSDVGIHKKNHWILVRGWDITATVAKQQMNMNSEARAPTSNCFWYFRGSTQKNENTWNR